MLGAAACYVFGNSVFQKTIKTTVMTGTRNRKLEFPMDSTHKDNSKYFNLLTLGNHVRELRFKYAKSFAKALQC